MDTYVRDGFVQIAWAMENQDGDTAARTVLALVDYMGGSRYVVQNSPPERGILYVLSLAIGRLYV